MKQVTSISITELKEMAKQMYDPLVKAVVDVERGKLVVDAELHVDEEQWLLEDGSKQSNLWGINLWPEKFGSDDFIEYDSMINIRPGQQNDSRDVLSAEIRQQVVTIVKGIVHE